MWAFSSPPMILTAVAVCQLFGTPKIHVLMHASLLYLSKLFLSREKSIYFPSFFVFFSLFMNTRVQIVFSPPSFCSAFLLPARSLSHLDKRNNSNAGSCCQGNQAYYRHYHSRSAGPGPGCSFLPHMFFPQRIVHGFR